MSLLSAWRAAPVGAAAGYKNKRLSPAAARVGRATIRTCFETEQSHLRLLSADFFAYSFDSADFSGTWRLFLDLRGVFGGLFGVSSFLGELIFWGEKLNFFEEKWNFCEFLRKKEIEDILGIWIFFFSYQLSWLLRGKISATKITIFFYKKKMKYIFEFNEI